MKTINIKGKEYVEVNERILYFRENYPNHKVLTEIISNIDGVCIMKAYILNADNEMIATGHAYEKEGSTFINKTSYIENCETSAVGRALGMLGIGIDTSIASAEEVGNAIQNQSTNKSPVAEHETAPKQHFNDFAKDTTELFAYIDKQDWPETKKAAMKQSASKDPVLKQNILEGKVK